MFDVSLKLAPMSVMEDLNGNQNWKLWKKSYN